MAESEDRKGPVSFAIFRASEARPDAEAGLMTYEPYSPTAQEGLDGVVEAGFHNGHDLRVLFSTPGFSLIRLWFKSDFPLPRHVHDVGCLYYVLGGTLQIGDQQLGPGDGFFVGREVPYTYKVGPAGVELLEFRAAERFIFRNLAENGAFWEAAAGIVRGRQAAWREEPRPTSA